MAFGWDDIIGGLIGGIAGLFGADAASDAALAAAALQADAATYAADKQYQSAAEANALQKEMYDQSRTDQLPWLEAGKTSLGTLSDLLKPGGALTEDFSYKDFSQKDWQDPGYDFRLSEGQKALERSAAARGGLKSGGTLKALTDYAQGAASQEYQNSYNRYDNDYRRAFDTFNANKTNLFNRLASMAGVGQQTATTLGSAGQNYATNAGNTSTTAAARASDYSTDAAAARASGYMGSANAWNDYLSGLSNLFKN